MNIPSDEVHLSRSLAGLIEVRAGVPDLSNERRTLLRREFMAQVRKAPSREDVRDAGTT